MSAEPRLKTIAVATDFSDNSGVALACASELARRHGARLVLVHAVLPATPPVPEFVVLPPRYYEEIKDSARRRLEALVAELAQSGLQATPELVVGTAVPSVLEAAERHHADLLVAGTRGRTGWKRVLLGSTAAHLVRDARCPVVTVHPTDAGAPRPARTVLAATDFSDEASGALAAADALGSAEVAQHVVLLHVYRLPNEALHLPAQLLADAVHEARERAQREADAVAASLARPGRTVSAKVLEGYPPELILDEARRVGADLITLGTHGRSGLDRLFLGSTAERVLPAAPCPVLTLRRSAA